MPETKCPQCGMVLRAPPEAIGKRVACSGCRHVFVATVLAPQAQYPQQLYPQAQGPPMVPELGKKPGTAVASLVLGIISIPTCILYGIPSLVCGILAVVFSRSSHRNAYPVPLAPSSAGMAKAGLICGWVGIALSIAFWVLAAIGFAIGMSEFGRARYRYY